MNIADVLIILLVLGALARGARVGFVRQAFATAGFFGGLVLGALVLEPYLVSLVHTPALRLIVTLAATLGTALLFFTIGEFIGIVIKQRMQFRDDLNHVDNSFGSALAGVSLLAMVWLGAALLVNLPYQQVQTEIKGSKIVEILNKNLPAAPTVIASLGRLIDPNGFPDVFIQGTEPAPSTTSTAAPADLAAAVQKDRASVVKVEGQGCGGIVEGSGFVVTKDLVATNAHVLAGIKTPYVVDSTGTHQATPIWFDPDLDFAVLRVSGLAGDPLPFNTNQITHGTPGGVLGYPGGGQFDARSTTVLDEFIALGRNIYNQGDTRRDVYSIQADVVPGNSGGPLVDTTGKVMGVVFATSTTYNHVGYALSVRQVLTEIDQAQARNQEVDTGSCTE